MKKIIFFLLKGILIVSALSMISCEGETGPIGTQGPQGDPGLQGVQGEPGEPCTVSDNGNGTFTITCAGSSVTFGEREEPEEFTTADRVRGGQLYDRFWTVTGSDAPTTTHSLYPDFGSNTGSTSWRCKECHGWDYLGKDGRYKSGSHYTGISGIYPAKLSLWKAYMVISDNHSYGDAGLTSDDIWDLVKFYIEGMTNVTDLVDNDGAFSGDLSYGEVLYNEGIPGWSTQGTTRNVSCATCHGFDGTDEIVPGFEDYIGFLSNENPQEFQHKVRYGQPGSLPEMPASESINASMQDVADLSAYSQTLSPFPWESTSVWRGARLYDRYWAETGRDAPNGDHSLYPSIGPRTGNTTWRCKECHGWDYIGKYGRYASGSHYTGIDGLFPPSTSKWRVYESLKESHGYSEEDLNDADILDLVAFYDAGMFDINFIMNSDGSFNGDPVNGQVIYENGLNGTSSCSACHGLDGLSAVVPGFEDFPGFLSKDNPQEFAHKALYGHPGTLMRGIYEGGATLKDVADLSAYCQTLPTSQ